MGHVRNYTMGDVLARYRRMNGLRGAPPDGLGRVRHAGRECGDGEEGPSRRLDPVEHRDDAGAAEAARLRARLEPRARDLRSRLITATSRRCSSTCSRPAWSIARQSAVNWDPVDMTVLANEQVIDGRGWRSGALVERRKLSQWFLKITDFAEELLDGLDELDQWPDKVRLMQENWIGKSQGLRIPLRPRIADRRPCDGFEVFTTRPDTIFGASFAAHRARSSDRAGAGRATIRRSPPSSPSASRAAPPPPRSRPPRRRASTPASSVAPPARCRLDAAALRRQFRADGLRHRRDLRLPGARPARPRFRPQIWPAGHPRRRRRRRRRRPSRSATKPIPARAGW